MTVATSVQKFLDSQGIQYETVTHEHTADSRHSAKAAHIPGDRLAKCVLLEDSGDYLMAVLPAARKIDLDAVCLRLNRTFGLANREQLAALFKDCETGAIPPLGPAYGLSCILDETLVGCPDVYFEGGDHQTLVHVRGDDFVRLTGGAMRGEFSRAY